MGYHYTAIRIPNIQNSDKIEDLQGTGTTGTNSLLARMQNGTATLEHSLTISCQVKYSLSIWSSDYTPRLLPKYGENLYPQKPEHKCLKHLY